MLTPDSGLTSKVGLVDWNLISCQQKSLSSRTRDIECSGLLKGFHKKAPIGRRETGSGVFSSSGLMQDVQEE
jgi:hypothetical protein